MRKLVEDAHLLDEFIHEQPTYSSDFKALAIKLLDQHQNVEQVAALTNVPARTLYQWLSDWNQLKKKP
ncbi:helix-turn-helix domain-containing protein [Spirosoma utsteinense]|uniref:Transposase-like protein n=1 Tax=Spirosoma utsteinense TaxID=2585773 RepID=A0ABR6WGX9_9BACT|nr:helix-turn-helix domain-containing protein [Spirosoma utsteinense]MBC3789480.1 transposase-like protein [Spirosoma utsteinense]MBC3795385.1 transposase-like protein [Spirosoma utsteinense]